MIKIVNVFVTRKCNRHCEYCGISTPAPFASSVYAEQKRTMQQAPIEKWILFFTRLKKYNPNAFTVFFGGEPFLNLPYLKEVIGWFHKNDMSYTIISNCSKAVQPNIYELINHLGEPLQGLTASIDPYPKLLTTNPVDTYTLSEEEEKTYDGYNFLTELIKRGLVKDPVAEMVADSITLKNLEKCIDIINAQGICCDVNVLDQAKNSMYDYSSIISSNSLVEKSVAKLMLARIAESNKNIHMKEEILPMIAENLPSNYDCKLEDGLHNISVESDLTLRLCARIWGRFSHDHSALDLFTDEGNESAAYKDIFEAMCEDKRQYCERCAWSCAMMSRFDNGSAIHA